MRNRFLVIIPATLLATSLMLSCVSQQASNDSGGLATLRGAPVSAQEKVPTGDGLKNALETAPIDRVYLDQPPLVSHAVDDYPITKDANKCMDCHSMETYKKEKATKVSKTHFEAADGKTLSNVSSRRHFCTQCHVPQVDAKPLVSNTFQRAK